MKTFRDYPRWMLRKNSIEFSIGLDPLFIQIVHGLYAFLWSQDLLLITT